MRNRKDNEVDLERFTVILDAYGAGSSVWPEDDRQSALALLETSVEAAKLCDEAAALDRLLDGMPSLEPSAVLEERILHSAPAPSVGLAQWFAQATKALWPFGASWKPAVALAAAAVAGLVVGVVSPTEPMADEITVVAEVALNTAEDWGDAP